MANVIWKFTLDTSGVVMMPKGAKPISAREQGDALCVWAIVDPEAPKVSRRVYIIGTGHEGANYGDLPFLGTALLMGGRLVIHVFDGGEMPLSKAGA